MNRGVVAITMAIVVMAGLRMGIHDAERSRVAAARRCVRDAPKVFRGAVIDTFCGCLTDRLFARLSRAEVAWLSLSFGAIDPFNTITLPNEEVKACGRQAGFLRSP